MSYNNEVKLMSRTITFQPSKELLSFIEGQIETGNFQNQSEVVRAGLRSLQEQSAESKLQQLKEFIDEAENSPTIENWSKEEFLTRMKSKVHAPE